MFIGDGSFGDCFQNSFQGIKVSIKVFKDKTERGKIMVKNEAIALSLVANPNQTRQGGCDFNITVKKRIKAFSFS